MTATEKGFTLWFTGLSGAGKTTISELVETSCATAAPSVEILDGDVVRENLSKGLGFSKEDRDTNIRRIAFVARPALPQRRPGDHRGDLPVRGDPRRGARDHGRRASSRSIVEASVETCAERDVKGLYKKAFAGEIKEFTGVSDPYEAPEGPEIVLRHRETRSRTSRQPK